MSKPKADFFDDLDKQDEREHKAHEETKNGR